MKPPTEQEIFTTVSAILIANGPEGFACEPERVTMEARLVEDLSLDSLDRVDLVMSLEDAFSIDITDKEAEAFTTVGDLVRHIAQNTGHARTSSL